MFWTLKLIFVADILTYIFGLETVWATYLKIGRFFQKSFGHSDYPIKSFSTSLRIGDLFVLCLWFGLAYLAP
jgi:hypothetical protein